MMIKEITYGGKRIAACDNNCNKAWGRHSRPTVVENDFCSSSYSDEELGTAPLNPGTYEGSDGKPTEDSQKMNKWCVRECERCVIVREVSEINLPDFTIRNQLF